MLPCPLLPVARLLPLLCDLHAGAVSQLDLQLGLLSKGAQCPVHLPLDVVQRLVLADVFLLRQHGSVLCKAHFLCLALLRHLHDAL